jgi:hypothetical protein
LLSYSFFLLEPQYSAALGGVQQSRRDLPTADRQRSRDRDSHQSGEQAMIVVGSWEMIGYIIWNILILGMWNSCYQGK